MHISTWHIVCIRPKYNYILHHLTLFKFEYALVLCHIRLLLMQHKNTYTTRCVFVGVEEVVNAITHFGKMEIKTVLVN